MRSRVIALGIAAIAVALLVFAGGWVRGGSQVLPVGTGAAPSPRSGLPNPRLTPGAINPAVTAKTISETICRSGWTRTVRPPAAYTNALKLAQIIEYGYVDRSPKDYQEDHLVPLELGGAPRDPRNLWPQPNVAELPDGTAIGANEKDDLEDDLRRRVCARQMDLKDAQRQIAGDWVSAWDAVGRP